MTVAKVPERKQKIQNREIHIIVALNTEHCFNLQGLETKEL